MYVIEVNPRASRTIPFIAKVTCVPMVRLATKVMLGQTLAEMGREEGDDSLEPEVDEAIATIAAGRWPSETAPPAPLYVRPADAAPSADTPPVLLD